MAEEPVREDGTASEDRIACALVEELREIYVRTADEAAEAEPHKRIPNRVGQGLLAVGEDEQDFCRCDGNHSVPRNCFAILPNPHAQNVFCHFFSSFLDNVIECLEHNPSPASSKVWLIREFFGFGEADVPRTFTEWLRLARRVEVRRIEEKARFGYASGAGKPPKYIQFNRECAAIAAAVAPIFRKRLEAMLTALVAQEPLERDQGGIEIDQGSAAVNRFERRGGVWLISFGGETAMIPTLSGMEYIAMLLREPLRPIEALSLSALSSSKDLSIRPSTPMDGETIAADEFADVHERSDEKAIQQYKRRALDLKEEIEDARERHDSDREAELTGELEAIVDHLSAETGLGGRRRKFANDAEKARVRVTIAINRALDKIAAHAPKAADHLRSNIEKGVSMMYRDQHTSWKL